jgi:hypothetical protein
MKKSVLLTVRRLFEMYASGKYSLKELAIWSEQAGLRLRKTRRPLRASAICAILHSSGYCTLTHPGIDGPIVSRELWDAVELVRAQRNVLRWNSSRSPGNQ